MIIKPKSRGFICTNAHPYGCEIMVEDQIKTVKSKNLTKNNKNVLIIGSSSGYGLASRITAAFGCNNATIGVFLEKEPKANKTASAGYYNTVAFSKYAAAENIYYKNINMDAYAAKTKEHTIDVIKQDLKKIDLVIYSLASPVRNTEDGETIKSTLKPIGSKYTSQAINLNQDTVDEITIEPASQAEINNTITVMGGSDWEEWIEALKKADVLAQNCHTIAYSYIGTDITFPIYYNGTIGAAKKDLAESSIRNQEKLSSLEGQSSIAVLKSVVTQASAAIPVLPLYISILFKKMKELNTHEDCIDQTIRLFAQDHSKSNPFIRLDNFEMETNGLLLEPIIPIKINNTET